MTATKTTIPKNIRGLLDREAELQSSLDKWSVQAFRTERDRLTAVVHSGSATDEEIALHAEFRDAGPVNQNFTAMEASCSAALVSFRRANWQEFKKHLLTRLESRHQREADILVKLAEIACAYGIRVSHEDDQAGTTRQLEEIVKREDPGWNCFSQMIETF